MSVPHLTVVDKNDNALESFSTEETRQRRNPQYVLALLAQAREEGKGFIAQMIDDLEAAAATAREIQQLRGILSAGPIDQARTMLTQLEGDILSFRKFLANS